MRPQRRIGSSRHGRWRRRRRRRRCRDDKLLDWSRLQHRLRCECAGASRARGGGRGRGASVVVIDGNVSALVGPAHATPPPALHAAADAPFTSAAAALVSSSDRLLTSRLCTSFKGSDSTEVHPPKSQRRRSAPTAAPIAPTRGAGGTPRNSSTVHRIPMTSRSATSPRTIRPSGPPPPPKMASSLCPRSTAQWLKRGGGSVPGGERLANLEHRVGV